MSIMKTNRTLIFLRDWLLSWVVVLFVLFALVGCSGDSSTNLDSSDSEATPQPEITAVRADDSADHVESSPENASTEESLGMLAARLDPMAQARPSSLLAARSTLLQDVIESDPPILLLPNSELSENEERAQRMAIQNSGFLRFTRQGPQATPLLNEIMGVRPALPSDLDQSTAANCAPNECYRVEMYNYAYNLTTIALVDVGAEEVLDVINLPGAQPDIPEHLTALAVDIAVNAPEVADALGLSPKSVEAIMPNIKTALNDSRCERSKHLCVAPTFVVDDRALWAIVDLTDLRLVGVRWTDLGRTTVTPAVTEESLQNEVVSELYCERSTLLERNGWSMEYMLTSSDGLRLGDVQFQDRQVMRSAKLVDWHVSYSERDGFGYSDAIGCPIFSSAAVIAYNGPYVEEIEEEGKVVGFRLIQDFLGDGWPQPCHYRYQQRYTFYNDGRFRVGGANLGRGCGTDGIYRPVLRIDITAGGSAGAAGGSDSFAEWTEEGWSPWLEEQWRLQTAQTEYTSEGYQYQVTGVDGGGYYIEPGNGQFGDGGRGDNAYMYVTKRHADRDEGDADLVTIGSCCNNDHQQGPEKFMQPAESIQETDLVIWYVPQLPNDDRPGSEYCWADAIIKEGVVVNQVYPCTFGPLFVPIQ